MTIPEPSDSTASRNGSQITVHATNPDDIPNASDRSSQRRSGCWSRNISLAQTQWVDCGVILRRGEIKRGRYNFICEAADDLAAAIVQQRKWIAPVFRGNQREMLHAARPGATNVDPPVQAVDGFARETDAYQRCSAARRARCHRSRLWRALKVRRRPGLLFQSMEIRPIRP
jgi:hypothetical protein